MVAHHLVIYLGPRPSRRGSDVSYVGLAEIAVAVVNCMYINKSLSGTSGVSVNCERLVLGSPSRRQITSHTDAARGHTNRFVRARRV